MQCPFLKKINFKKVNQIVSEQQHQQDCRQASQTHYSPSNNHFQINFDLQEETIDIVNESQANSHKVYYFTSNLNCLQNTHCPLQIKIPKQLQTKKMIFGCTNKIEENQEQDIIQTDNGRSNYIPHILTSKAGKLSNKCQNIFHGQVVVNEQNTNFQCQLKDYQLKFIHEKKIRYYFQLKKVHINLKNINYTKLTLLANCKNQQLILLIDFKSQKRMASFLKAFQLNTISIMHDQFDSSNKLKLSYSIDSLGFQVERMNIQKLKSVADTFDILIFKNKNIMSKVQRVFTSSDYDHVAMILRTNDNQFFILQSSSNNGVGVYTLDSLILLPRKKYYYRVGYRKYDGERNYSQIIALQSFIKNTLGKKYKFDPLYLIGNPVKTEQTFFCSELIAQALQVSNLMKKQKPSYKYLPRHFSTQQLNEQIIKGSYSQTIILE